MTNEPGLSQIRMRHEAGAACPADAGAESAMQDRLVELLGAVADGDRSAFTEFYRATSRRVFGLALRVLRNPSVAEEVAQEVYLQVWTLAADYDRGRASPIGWLMMLTHRRSVDRVRAEQSAGERDIVFGHAHLGRDHDSVAEAVDQRLDEESVLDCLDTMTVLQREAVALAYYGGRTYVEVADSLRIPLPTVKSRIRDGLKRLENCLTGGDNR
ncbi:ECF RNA polymerase sigma factor SigK [Nocardia mangyaensis]|uniref:ECF RNA polymerase sigma factor SigK n=1 Tax=Nocardia mangyaensis TaxID=2213200 RepID=UPI0026771CA8|nr:ECF RNA polymerase sigma factor SigK [Nocardia mangyaensis]MDO3648182.1 ECF RNA polymerase sigma factor SigK [Nocardia mangyaensis]